MCGITGTSLASPFHRHPDADNLSELPLEKISELDGVLVDVSGSGQRAIDRSQLLPFDCRRKGGAHPAPAGTSTGAPTTTTATTRS